jgi:hypothetical protein
MSSNRVAVPRRIVERIIMIATQSLGAHDLKSPDIWPVPVTARD